MKEEGGEIERRRDRGVRWNDGRTEARDREMEGDELEIGSAQPLTNG